MPIGSADHHLNELLTKYCEEALAHRGTGHSALRTNVEKAIATLLPHGKAQAAEVARRLGMSPRTLTRRLASEGLTFSGILEEQRIDLARHYLQESQLPVSQIGWLLGYRELSAFTHAYKRWTGTNPETVAVHAAISPTEDNVAAPRTRGGQRKTPMTHECRPPSTASIRPNSAPRPAIRRSSRSLPAASSSSPARPRSMPMAMWSASMISRLRPTRCFAILAIALQASGCTAANLVKLTVFLTDMENLARYREARNRFFASVTPPAAPAVTLVEVSKLYGPDFKIEIEAIAAI